jgi:hypothetical protein
VVRYSPWTHDFPIRAVPQSTTPEYSFSIQSSQSFPYEYRWVGGADGYSGKLFLNVPQSPSGGGSTNNIGPGSFIGTPGGLFTINLETAVSSQAFTWDSSGINNMFISWTKDVRTPSIGSDAFIMFQGSPGNSQVHSLVISNTSTGEGLEFFDFSGTWTAIPEPNSAVAVGALLVISAFLIKRRKSVA